MITIGIATHNRPRMVKTLLMSLLPLAKKYKLEVIVVNDGQDPELANKNGIRNFMNGFIKQVGAGKIFTNDKNENIYNVRLKILKEATTNWIYFCDDDDLVNVLTLNNIIENFFQTESAKYLSEIDYVCAGFLEYRYSENGGLGLFSKFDYQRLKPKIMNNLNGNIFNLGKLRENISLFEEYISTIDHSMRIGEDIVLSYHLLGKKREGIAHVFEDKKNGPLTLMDYCSDDAHMSDKDTETFANSVGSFRGHCKNTLDPNYKYL